MFFLKLQSSDPRCAILLHVIYVYFLGRHYCFEVGCKLNCCPSQWPLVAAIGAHYLQCSPDHAVVNRLLKKWKSVYMQDKSERTKSEGCDYLGV